VKRFIYVALFSIALAGCTKNATEPETVTTPRAPTLVAPAASATGISVNPTLSWLGSSGVTSYGLQVSVDSLFGTFACDQNGITALSRSISGLDTTTTYYWRVNAANSAGTSDWSVVWHFRTTGTGLVAYYPFTGNADDASGNGHHGKVVGATLTTDRFGAANSAYSFNGTGNIITLWPANQLGIYDQDFTVSAWFNGSSFTSRDATILGNDYGTNNTQLAFAIRYNKPLMGFCWNDTYGKSSILTSTWYHVVFRYIKSNGEHGIFVNGVKDTLSTGHSAFVGTDTVRVGRWNRGTSTVGSTYFSGVLDDIRIYSRALDTTEIKTLYHEGGW
jgi:hypothetical protein